MPYVCPLEPAIKQGCQSVSHCLPENFLPVRSPLSEWKKRFRLVSKKDPHQERVSRQTGHAITSERMASRTAASRASRLGKDSDLTGILLARRAARSN